MVLVHDADRVLKKLRGNSAASRFVTDTVSRMFFTWVVGPINSPAELLDQVEAMLRELHLRGWL